LKNTPWVWDVHFKQQTKWINHCNVTLICYSKKIVENFNNITNCTAKYDNKIVNQAFKNNEHKPTWNTLTPQTKSFLLKKYADDFELYSKHCDNITNFY